MQIRLFLALSRTPHGVVDLATPAVCALLWMGRLPSPDVIVLGLVTAFAGYTAVYALNDIADFRTDQKKIGDTGLRTTPGDLDAAFVRHPMAQGFLSLRAGLIWAGCWGGMALVGAYALNLVCAAVFLLGCFLEFLYCRMLQVSPWRTAISGVVKTLGGIAAVLAVAPNPSLPMLAVLFLWLFAWEIGGQNIPNDWTDMDEDSCLGACSIPARLGRRTAALVILVALVATIALSVLLFVLAPVKGGPLLIPAVLAAGLWFLLWPAVRLVRSGTILSASALFNRASYYPLGILMIVLIGIVIF